MPDYVYLPFKRYDRTQNLSLILLHILNVGCGGGSVVLFYLSEDANITVNVIYVINSLFFFKHVFVQMCYTTNFETRRFLCTMLVFRTVHFFFLNEFLSLV